MRVDISFLPALAATFMLVFARIGAMVMLLPGFGETNIPTRIKLSIALLLTLIILPLHRSAYQVDMSSLTPLMVLMLHNTDIPDGWEREGEDPEYFFRFSPDTYAIGIDAVLYAMTH